jgi:ketosteroid isomerase-like protein
MKRLILTLYLLSLAPVSLLAQDAVPNPDPSRQIVEAIERSFARTMAERNFEEFSRFIAEEAVFFSGSGPLRGKPEVLAAWQPYFEGPDAPFAWEPERVEVLGSDDLAFSSGPVYGPDGQRVATFNSVWRRDESGDWKIVFDKGSRYCE